MTKYPVYIHDGDETHAYGMTIPDFDGCFSASDTLEDIKKNVQEAIECYCSGETFPIPEPSKISELKKNKEYSGGRWEEIEIDLVAVRRGMSISPEEDNHTNQPINKWTAKETYQSYNEYSPSYSCTSRTKNKKY